jgi:hypothetical protein
MRNKVLNIFLIVILGGVLTSLIGIEVNYKRAKRTEWYSTVSTTEGNSPIFILSGLLYTDDAIIEFPKIDYKNDVIYDDNGAIGDGVKEGFFPKKIKIKWFSYGDNKFYSLETDLPVDKCNEAIHHAKDENFMYNIIINPKGYFSIYLNDNREDLVKVGTFKAQETTQEWTLGADRDSDVKATIAKVRVYPKLKIEGDSKFKSLTLNYLNRYSGIQLDSISNNRVIFFDSVPRGMVRAISLELTNPKFEGSALRIDASFDNRELAALLGPKMDDKLELEIEITRADSLGGISFIKGGKKISLKKTKVYFQTLY